MNKNQSRRGPNAPQHLQMDREGLPRSHNAERRHYQAGDWQDQESNDRNSKAVPGDKGTNYKETVG